MLKATRKEILKEVPDKLKWLLEISATGVPIEGREKCSFEDEEFKQDASSPLEKAAIGEIILHCNRIKDLDPLYFIRWAGDNLGWGDWIPRQSLSIDAPKLLEAYEKEAKSGKEI